MQIEWNKSTNYSHKIRIKPRHYKVIDKIKLSGCVVDFLSFVCGWRRWVTGCKSEPHDMVMVLLGLWLPYHDKLMVLLQFYCQYSIYSCSATVTVTK